MDFAKIAAENAPWLDLDEDVQLAAVPGLRFDAWREQRDRETAEGHVLVVLRHEIATCAMFVAAAAALANFSVAEGGRETRISDDIRRIMPPEPQAVSLALGTLGRAGLPTAFITAVLDFTVRVRLARQACMYLTPVPAAEGGLADLGDQLCRLCLEAVDVMRGFDEQIARLGVAIDGPALTGALSAERLAFAAGHGGWPCIDEHGRVEIPTWVENRRLLRRRTETACQVSWGDQSSAATIIDVSPLGAGLKGLPEIGIGTPVDLRLASGDLITAEVMWQAGGRCGVRFAEPLRPELLAALDNG